MKLEPDEAYALRRAFQSDAVEVTNRQVLYRVARSNNGAWYDDPLDALHELSGDSSMMTYGYLERRVTYVVNGPCERVRWELTLTPDPTKTEVRGDS